ncbi:MAG: hypothetical protein Terrestrivirus4_150 [Terrestrivirus sp.]|uniref:Uncharacterized protein n=1 Tax=Terrestrivirus sp. TaxID=2487775 RepID=A0A3G4ZML9_9VIRU|nr:MAG: hypothetical protein Terrestrivirus4_150 [Terrestrivirus sp.]
MDNVTDIDFYFTKNKHASALKRKRFRKRFNYRCCDKPIGNRNKESSGYCCSYPMVYKHYDQKVDNMNLIKDYLSEPF